MAEDFSKLVEQTKLNNEKQDRVIELLAQANQPETGRELQRASKDEVEAEYDVLKRGNVFTIAYNRLTGIDQTDNILEDKLTPAQVNTNTLVEDLTNKTVEQNNILNKIGAALFIGLRVDEKLQASTDKQLLLASNQFNYDKKQDNEEERRRLLDQQSNDTTTGSATTGGDQGGSFLFGGLGALGKILGLTAFTLGGSLLGVKLLQDPAFRQKVSDLFSAIGDVFRVIVDDIFTPLFPVLKGIVEFNIFLLTKAFEFTGSALSTLADFAKEIAAVENDEGVKTALLGAAPTALVLKNAIPRLLGPNGPFGAINRALFGTPTFVGAGQVVREGGLFNSLLKIFRPMINLAAGIMTFGVVRDFTGLFGATGTRVGRFMTAIGRIFYPLTLALSAYEAVTGFIDGYFQTETVVGPAGMSIEQTPPMIRRIVNGVEGALLGLLNALVYYPLDFLRTSINYITEKIFGVEILPSDAEILGGLNSLFEGIENFFIDFANFDARAYINENFPTIAKILDFVLGTEVDELRPQIAEQRAVESQIENLQDKIAQAQAKLDDENFTGNREYFEDQIAMRQAQIDELDGLLSPSEIANRIIRYQDLVDQEAGGILGTRMLTNRIEELNQQLAEQGLSLQNVNGQPVVVQTSNNQQNFNQGNTVSIGKETTPNDSTFNALLSAGGAI